MTLPIEASNDAVTGMFHHPQSAANNTIDDAGRALVTGSTGAGDLHFSPVVGDAGPTSGPTNE